jgi:NitT/TauT family transport system substrate-binding protein
MTPSSTTRKYFIMGSAAAIAGAPLVARSATTEAISVALPTGDSSIAYIAQRMGAFGNAGLDVTLSVLASGAAIASATVGGAVDIGAVNVGSVAAARSRGVPLRIIAPARSITSTLCGDAIMVYKDSKLRVGADFTGKTVASVALKTTQHASFLAWVDKGGGDSKTVKVFEVPFAEMPGLLASGRVDASMPVEPFTARARDTCRVLTSAYAALPTPFLIYVFTASEAWIQAHPGTAAKFNAAIREAALWAAAHPKEAFAYTVEFMKIDPLAAKLMIPSTWGTTVNAQLVAPVIDVMNKYGFLAHDISPADVLA